MKNIPTKGEMVDRLAKEHAKVIEAVMNKIGTDLREAKSYPIKVAADLLSIAAVREKVLKLLHDTGWRVTTYPEKGLTEYYEVQ